MNDPKITLNIILIFSSRENDSLDFGFPQIQRLYNSAFGTDYNNLVLILSIFFEIRKGCYVGFSDFSRLIGKLLDKVVAKLIVAPYYKEVMRLNSQTVL